jgi:hypothetical protein
MEVILQTMVRNINDLVRRVARPSGSAVIQRKLRILIGVTVLIWANVELGAVIGHGLAAILGVAAFLVVTHDTTSKEGDDA